LGKLDDIARNFGITDFAGFKAAVFNAICACAEHGPDVPDFRECDTLDELVPLLNRAIELLRDPLNGNRLALYWRSLLADENITKAERTAAVPFSGTIDPGFAILDLLDLLNRVQRGAAEAHRGRAQQSGPLPKADIRAAVQVLIDYWRGLGRKFTVGSWAKGSSGLDEPVTEGERFVFACLRYFIPDRAHELKGIARYFRD
jgi:hypothetical protein